MAISLAVSTQYTDVTAGQTSHDSKGLACIRAAKIIAAGCLHFIHRLKI